MLKKIIIIISIIVMLAGATIALAYFQQLGPFRPTPQPTQPIKPTEPITDPINQNVLDYQLEEKPAPQASDPNDGYPRQLVLNQFNRLPNGNVEIKIHTDIKNTSDKKASCRLVLNGKQYLTEKVELNKQFASCRPLIVHESDIRTGTNSYEVFYQASDYKDRYAGEITKR